MGPDFNPMPTAEGWQCSNPNIFSLAALRSSLDLFERAGGMAKLRAKSVQLTGYLEFLLDQRLAGKVTSMTPRDPDRRGSQLSLVLNTLRLGAEVSPGPALIEHLAAAGVTVDWREPNVIRVAPTALYNRFSDVYHLVGVLEDVL